MNWDIGSCTLLLSMITIIFLFVQYGNGAYIPIQNNDSNYPEELYDQCVDVAEKSFCDFLFETKSTPSANSSVNLSDTSAWNSSDTSTKSSNSTFLTYNDNDNGFTIQHPSDWTFDNRKDTYAEDFTAVSFVPPDSNAVIEIRILPKGDYDSIKVFGDKEFKESDDYSLLAYYRNSSTLLSGKPAFKAIYLATYIPSFDEKLSGYQSSTFKSLAIGTMVPEKKSVFAVTYFAPPNEFDDYLPIVEKMIDSFQINAKGPVIQEDNSSSISPD